jgi:uroporphyrinogen-III synthase
MRLIVTRPEPEASHTAEALRARGHDILIAPMMHAHFFEPPSVASKTQPAAILFTSAQAARAVGGWPQQAAWVDVPVLTVGDHTADIARAAGFGDVRSAAGDAAALADLVRATIPIEAGSLLYPAAVDRSSEWTEALEQAGYEIDLIETYAMVAASKIPDEVLEALKAGSVDGVLFYSRRTADIFMTMVERDGKRSAAAKLRFFAMSQRVAEPLAGYAVAVAARPEEASLWALLDGPAGTAPASLR